MMATLALHRLTPNFLMPFTDPQNIFCDNKERKALGLNPDFLPLVNTCIWDLVTNGMTKMIHDTTPQLSISSLQKGNTSQKIGTKHCKIHMKYGTCLLCKHLQNRIVPSFAQMSF